jgi:hypothetical protein
MLGIIERKIQKDFPDSFIDNTIRGFCRQNRNYFKTVKPQKFMPMMMVGAMKGGAIEEHLVGIEFPKNLTRQEIFFRLGNEWSIKQNGAPVYIIWTAESKVTKINMKNPKDKATKDEIVVSMMTIDKRGMWAAQPLKKDRTLGRTRYFAKDYTDNVTGEFFKGVAKSL